MTTLGALALSKLPPSMQSPKMLALLSADGQIYVACQSCGWEHRVHLVSSRGKLIKRLTKLRCASCERKKLVPVRHAFMLTIDCADCRATSRVDVGADPDLTCPACQSRRITLVAEEVAPPYPAEFSELEPPVWRLTGGDDRPVWGRSGEADAQLIHEMARAATTLPEVHRYWYLLIVFARRLRITNPYEDFPGRYLIVNIAANMEQDYLRATGDPIFGAAAIADFEEMITLAPDEINGAIARHSFAMSAFSMLARWEEEWYADGITGRPGLRATALAAARESEEVLDRQLEQGSDWAAPHLARVRWVIGDLLRCGDTDDAQRREAIGYFTKALSEPEIAAMLGFGITQARAHTIMELADPEDELIHQALADLRLAAAAGGSDRAYEQRWISEYLLAILLMRYSGDRLAGLQEVESAAAHALQQFGGIGDERKTVYQADRFSCVFELLAYRYVDFGWNDEALAALEVMRGHSVRRYSMSRDRIDAELKDVRLRQLEDLSPPVLRDSGLPAVTPQLSKRRIGDYLEADPIGLAAQALMRGHGGDPTALLCLWVTELHPGHPVASALVCHMTGSESWDNKRHTWRADPEALRLLHDQRWSQPGPFRERLLDKSLRRGWDTLLAPVAGLIKETGATRLALSLPGALSRLPVEAFAGRDGGRLDGMALSYLPSVRFGADLVTRGGPAGDAPDTAAGIRVLALGYGGEDMPGEEAELADLAATWGGQVTVMPGGQCTKKSVLAILQDPWDVIHIACHGTFNPIAPLLSALHFRADPDDDAHRVTAMDLLREVKLSAHPLVILSACSSIVTAASPSNSLHGLSGSLFRAGARAIIGSRWPVADDAARACMAELHRALRSGQPADIALAQSTSALRKAAGRPAEDWAAFGYFGVA